MYKTLLQPGAYFIKYRNTTSPHYNEEVTVQSYWRCNTTKNHDNVQVTASCGVRLGSKSLLLLPVEED